MAAVRNARMKSLLTSREREVFELLVQDKTTRDIAEALFIREKTVRNHISNLMRSLVRRRPCRCDPRHAAAMLQRVQWTQFKWLETPAVTLEDPRSERYGR